MLLARAVNDISRVYYNRRWCLYQIIQLREINSLMPDNRPLYVIDGAIIGRDYARANEALNTADIASVRIIKDLAQLNRYGEQGRNGVIYIRSKASQNSKK